ncbi:MAG: ATPase [Bacteroidetes bacterium]|nr:MAG: ATPase [Bacteroidota bacterium]
MIRIAITGPESSGKTTLSEALSKTLNGLLVPEFARTYLMDLGRDYYENDLLIIARNQFKSNSQPTNLPYLIADTEMTVLKIWSEVKYGTCAAEIMYLFEQQQFDHYFLSFPDIPWEDDPLREHPEMREELFHLYQSELESRQLPYTIISGDLEQRIDLCLKTLGVFE